MYKFWLVIVLALVSWLALAQTSTADWRRFDANRDGAFDKEDFRLLLKNFATESTVDANRDGKLDAQDVIEIIALLSIWDKNADARVNDLDFVPVTIELKAADADGIQQIANGIVNNDALKNTIETQLNKEWADVARGSNQGRLYLQAATLAALRRQDAVALYLYAQAVLFNPRAVPALNGLGFFLGQRGRLQEALQILLAARGLDAKNCETHNNLGWVLARAGLHTLSLESYVKSTQLCPQVRQFMQNKAVAELRQNQRTQAAASLKNNPEVALSSLLNQSDQSTQEFDAAWNQESKKYPPTPGDIGSYLTAGTRMDFYTFLIGLKNTQKYSELEGQSIKEAYRRAGIISTIMKLPFTSKSISDAQDCANNKHRIKTFPIASELIKVMSAQTTADAIVERYNGQLELGNALLGAEDRFRSWVQSDIATIKRLEPDAKKAQVLIDNLLESTKEQVVIGRISLSLANSRPIPELDRPLRYASRPPVNYNLPEEQFEREYLGIGITIIPSNPPYNCYLDDDNPPNGDVPHGYLVRLLEFLGQSIMSREFAVDSGVVGVSYTPKDGEFKLRVGEGIFAEGLWNPVTGYGFNLGVGGSFKHAVGPLKLELEAKLYLHCKSNGANSIVGEFDLQTTTKLFEKNIGDLKLDGTADKTLWKPDMEIQISPASHEPIVHLRDMWGG